MLAAPRSRPPRSVTPSRVAAASILRAIRDGHLLDQAFDAHTTSLDPRDRRWVRELCWGMLRRRGIIDAWLSARVTGGLDRLDPELVDLLRLGTCQLVFMDSVPAYAAIGQTVELVKSLVGVGAAGLANAVLRRIDRERASLQLTGGEGDPITRLATDHSHPRWLVARWVARLGHDATRELLEANNREAPLGIRPWGDGARTAALATALTGSGLDLAPAPFGLDGWDVRGAGRVTDLPGFTEGSFFIQDPAASLVVAYAAIAPDATVLDLCAAPGGKAIELARTARTVIAADRSLARLARVRENIARLRVSNMFPVVADATHPPFARADAVLVDAPCTGTGTFRRHPDARWRLKPSDMAVTGAMQREILDAVAPLVRPGGLLIYSTCSLELEENEERVAAFLGEHPEFVLAPPAGAVPVAVLSNGFLRVSPSLAGTDGAFAARLLRREVA